ncbi:MAG TPA: FxSxx-COOH system tetratricopeptide repeat protein [Ktedonobacteraceae bacterium]|jgi:tetratricopeptide (TPR) repeat protein
MQTKDKKSNEHSPSLPPQDRHNQLWMVPLARNPYFTGREAELQEVSADLRAGEPGAGGLAISAPGGCGKTHLALEYAYRQREQYRAVFWVTASSHATLNGAYSDIAMLLDLPEKGQQELLLIVRAVVAWLEHQQDWLLILDDLGDASLLKDFLPETFSGHLLLTTRNGISGKLARRLRLKKPSLQESRQFLQRRCGQVDPSSAEKRAAAEIVAQLDALPLAQEVAGAYIAATSCSLPGYLDRLHQQDEPADRRAAEPVRKTVRLACEKIAKASAGALDLLHLCAFFAPDEIPETLLLAGAPVVPRPLQKLLTSASRREVALNLLQEYALIVRDRTSGVLSMQREVQAALRALLSQEMERTRAQLAVRVVGSLFPALDINDWEACQRLLVHAQACIPLLERWQMQALEGAWLLHHAGWYLHVRGEYTRAQICEEQALAIYRAHFGDEHPATAMMLNNLAVTYEDRGKLKEALSLHQQALSIRRATLGEHHPETITSRRSLASLYQEQGKGEQAAALWREVLAIERQLAPPQHLETAATLVSLASLCHGQGQYEEAFDLYQQALAIRRKELGSKHAETLVIVSGLAGVRHSQQRFDEAEALLRQMLAIQRKGAGRNLELAATLQSLAQVYQARGELDMAAFWLQQTLAIEREVAGGEQASPARMLETLAIAYEEQEASDKAEALYQQVLAIYRQTPEVYGSDIARCCYNLALLYQEQKRLTAARTLLEQALAGWQEHAGAERAETKQVRAKYEQLLQKIQESREKRVSRTSPPDQQSQAPSGAGARKTRGAGRKKR